MTKQVNGKGQNLTPRHTKSPKPLNRTSAKLAGVIRSWVAPGMQNFVAIGFAVSVPLIRDFANPFGVTSFLFVFWGFFNKATAYTPERIFTQNTSNDVVPGKEVPFGGSYNYVRYLDPLICEKPPFWGPILTGLRFLAAEITSTWGRSNIKLPLIVIVAP